MIPRALFSNNKIPVWLPQAQPLSSQRISEQLAVVDQSLMDWYFKRRHDRILKAQQKVSAANIPQFLALDSTSISTYSETIASAAYGHARQDPHLRQVNLSLGVDYETGDVCYAYESEGSTNDRQLYLAIVQRMIDHQFDLSNTVLVTDRGYHSLMNMLISTAFPLTILLLPMAA
ncbi:transposase [Sutterella wadsworthensis]|uniref:transposase n=1 Tax=Sutterella wadsworthensis TaxID=40545 RepID=UPI0013F69D91|nr:transposase [Sutterella wadsworthensis]